MIDPNVEPEPGTLMERIVDAIRTVYDPEIPVNLYDLGLIYEIEPDQAGRVRLVMTLTSPNCPVAETLPGEVESKVRSVEGVSGVDLELTWEPKWTPERLSDAAKLELEFTGHTGPLGGPRDPFTSLTTDRQRKS